MAGPGPRRTRGHVIASQSFNYVEKFFIDKGHVASRPAEDYGIDMIVSTFDEDGYAQPGDIYLQLKASDWPAYSKDRSSISCKVGVQHYRLWMAYPLPVFLVVYDAGSSQAFWLDVQDYFRAQAGLGPRPGADSVTIRLPTANVFTGATVDYAVARKAATLYQVAEEVEHHD